MRTRSLHQLHQLDLHATPAPDPDDHDATPRGHVRQDAGQAGRPHQLEHDVVGRLCALVSGRQHRVGTERGHRARGGRGRAPWP